ncbi:hypothetical protein XPU_2045 [Xanthomonas arboricola pv. pruni str. MAFF 311562]|uniref:Uncharacterized protein n=1 Tax=Xanthomonas arboricola pv. pruni str. MAFF 311562 TaxID=1414836 RepID=W4S2X7_9XANT|nr:hypothetical protein XPU_2045 [Xanthomonas arboricola pv. pruni str. MAFF 311562]
MQRGLKPLSRWGEGHSWCSMGARARERQRRKRGPGRGAGVEVRVRAKLPQGAVHSLRPYPHPRLRGTFSRWEKGGLDAL